MNESADSWSMNILIAKDVLIVIFPVLLLDLKGRMEDLSMSADRCQICQNFPLGPLLSKHMSN